ncbi:MAG: hypothetical protein HY395_03180 [Candidatus Doudnabacteria bacterium]|nr:hypothetical protein [Candidatus Doudnabacteria bacterium]
MTSRKKILFILLFVAFGVLALNIKLSNLAGSTATFTLFDSFAPISGAFLGTTWGVVSVIAMQFVNFLLHGSANFDAGFAIRLIPTAFAVIYFSRNTKFNILIPLLAMIAFISHPIGRTVWVYSLLWLIPVITYFFSEKSLVARSLGATFTAHAVGGALWIWAFNLPREVWLSLIPVVIIERLLFAAGIAVSFLAVKKLLELDVKNWLHEVFQG